MFVIQCFDVANASRSLLSNNTYGTLEDATRELLSAVLTTTLNDYLWINLHEGTFYIHSNTEPTYSKWNTLF